MSADFSSLERRLKALEKNRGAVLRFGTVTGVDEREGSARVQIGDADNLPSYPLRVVHSRTAKDRSQHLPDLGQTVACLFTGQGFEQGVVLGGAYAGNNPAPGRDPHVWYYLFEDGTEVEYDRKTHRLTGTVKGWVDVTVEKDVALKVLGDVAAEVDGNVSIASKKKITLTALDDITISSQKNVRILGAVSIAMTTPSFIMTALVGVCKAAITAALNLVGNLDQTGDHKLSGDVTAGGTVTDSGGNTNHHSH